MNYKFYLLAMIAGALLAISCTAGAEENGAFTGLFTSASLQRCSNSAQCPGSQVCLSNGLCGERFGCTVDAQCPGSQVCHNGLCGDRFGCRVDAQCPGAQICVDTFCVER